MKRLQSPSPPHKAARRRAKKKRSFGDVMFTAMFIGLVSTYIGSYLGTWTSTGDFLPLAVAFVAGLAMAVFEYFARVKKGDLAGQFLHGVQHAGGHGRRRAAGRIRKGEAAVWKTV